MSTKQTTNKVLQTVRVDRKTYALLEKEQRGTFRTMSAHCAFKLSLRIVEVKGKTVLEGGK